MALAAPTKRGLEVLDDCAELLHHELVLRSAVTQVRRGAGLSGGGGGGRAPLYLHPS